MGRTIDEPTPARVELTRRRRTVAAEARALGVHRVYLSYVLNGRIRPSDELRERIADHLGMTVEQAFGQDYEARFRTEAAS